MRTGPYRTHYEPFLYPLDGIANWNRLYGAKGFYQYQCVLPPATARDGTVELLRAIAASGQGSPLAVLKDFGPQPGGRHAVLPDGGDHAGAGFPQSGRADA